MHLKNLTLRGFKSFASATTLRFEPGITCVVGPNGSGKSNVVDALSWVMGEQGAKSLRGGKMEDVIFAGTSGRPPLGRAEVSLTIDNTDHALPIDYAEVTIARTMFRSGGSDYSINGSPCRLLDVQELLSDSGIGREMHVIVGQGQLDAILHASPEERRGFIEEAAGVLKHRKRKEKALRKLDSMQANLTRLADLAAEVRRQLKPLGRQAEVARRAQVVQADLRDAKARLLADDLQQLQGALRAEVADETALRTRKQEVEHELAGVQDRLTALELHGSEAAPQLAAAQETWYRLSSLRERVAGTASLAADRVRILSDAEPERAPSHDPEDLAAQARAVRAEQAVLTAQVARCAEALAGTVRAREAAEAEAAAEQQRMAARQRAAADRREGLARLTGQVAARQSTVDAGEQEIGRLRAAIADAEQRAERHQVEFAALENQVAGAEQGEHGLDAEHEAALAGLAELAAEVLRLQAAEREAEHDRATSTARREALELGLRRKDGAGALLAAGERLNGLLGSLAGLIQVRPGYENAVAAALSTAADAVAMQGPDDALAAIALLKQDDAGRSAIVLADAAGAPDDTPSALPGAIRLRDAVGCPPQLRPALDRLLHRVMAVADLPAACELVRQRPELSVVTPDGDVVTAAMLSGGSPARPSLIEVQAAVDEAAERVAEAGHRVERSRFGLQAALPRRDEAGARVEAALAALHESDARLSAVAEQLGQLGAGARAARAEAERLRRSLVRAEESLQADSAALQQLRQRLAAAETQPADDEQVRIDDRDRLAAAATTARGAEMESRLALRTTEERTGALAGRAEQLERAAQEERQAQQRAAVRRARRERQLVIGRAVLVGAEFTAGRLEISHAAAGRRRAGAEQQRAERERALGTAREAAQALVLQQAQLTDSVHRDEVARAEQRARIEALCQRGIDELGLAPEVLVEEYGPHQLVPPSPAAPGEEEPAVEPQPYPYQRTAQQKRLRAAERALSLLGTVNPLALEEFAALEERHRFLTAQLEDLKSSRRDLMDIVREVDERVEQAFTEAFQDTAREFEGVFARLFPGGEGRLVLTDPADMLATGLDVEARPPGKKVKRLSLLSGGERSLTAVALLIAIFRARPSPFYVLDEVEAALDDVNLGRLIAIMDELRESSQLIVITHQKRTMEVADSLYGVTMRGDGVSTVVSQRLREEQSA